MLQDIKFNLKAANEKLDSSQDIKVKVQIEIKMNLKIKFKSILQKQDAKDKSNHMKTSSGGSKN